MFLSQQIWEAQFVMCLEQVQQNENLKLIK